jgi:dephospho-CoA kinase
MLFVGITGGIGSGKSLVSRLFNLLGIPVYDADSAAKKLMRENDSLKQKIKASFGEDCYQNEELNTSYLSSVVFSDKEKLNLLNALVHPATIEDAQNWRSRQNAPYVIKEAALLFESGTAKDLDLIIGVESPVALRIHRVMERNNISREAVLERMKHQMEESIKLKLCDLVIHNNEQELVIPQVLNIHRLLLKRAAQTSPK